MPIMVLKGPEKSTEMLMQALRASQLAQRKGVVVLRQPKGDEHKIEYQIEKLLDGVTFPDDPPKDLKTLKWKPEPLVIVMDSDDLLDDFEDVCPGFVKHFGPVSEMDLK